ncbi:MAG: hypothetical protein LVT47_16410 [Cyanobacteria bacterium LVE1205-1]
MLIIIRYGTSLQKQEPEWLCPSFSNSNSVINQLLVQPIHEPTRQLDLPDIG